MGAELDANDLLARAFQETGCDDLGDIPYQEPLDVLLQSLNGEAGLSPDRLETAGATIVGLLVKRLRLVDDRNRFPQIADEHVTSPLFIIGLPRSGSTHLHALLGQVGGVRVPLYWEMLMPSPPPERETYATDPRIEQVQSRVAQLPPDMLKRHPIAVNRPEQCNLLNDWSLIHQALLAYYDVPGYRNWLLDADYTPAFEAHRRTLQHLQWRTPGQWVLKYPKHVMALDVLLRTYPDARLVWTHRDPAVVMPSVASFTGYIRASTTGAIDEPRYGREWTAFEELVLLRGLGVRDAVGNQDGRFYDLHYHELMADPLGAVAGVLDHFGLPFDADSHRAVEKWIGDHPRTEYGVHEYSPEQFGLSADRLWRRFAPYMERFGVQKEARA
jgi:hypothetical protein